MFSTRQKVALARSAYRAVHGVRSVLGRDDHVVVRRGGASWALDLGEGIDFSIWLLGSFERSSRAAYARLVEPGATVLDIGANVGAHTLPLARRVGAQGRVVAFEPTASAFAKLQRNVGLNPELASRVRLERMALGELRDTAAPAQLYSSWPLRQAAAAQHASHRGVLAATEGARATTLDAFLEAAGIERVDFIKLDVDGHECSVLRGAAATLSAHRPHLLVELMPDPLDEAGRTFEDLVGLLHAGGYRLLRVPSLRALPDSVGELRRLIPRGGSINVIARAQ